MSSRLTPRGKGLLTPRGSVVYSHDTNTLNECLHLAALKVDGVAALVVCQNYPFQPCKTPHAPSATLCDPPNTKHSADLPHLTTAGWLKVAALEEQVTERQQQNAVLAGDVKRERELTALAVQGLLQGSSTAALGASCCPTACPTPDWIFVLISRTIALADHPVIKRRLRDGSIALPPEGSLTSQQESSIQNQHRSGLRGTVSKASLLQSEAEHVQMLVEKVLIHRSPLCVP